MKKSLYEVLGVPLSATGEEIESGYAAERRRLERRLREGDREAENQLKFLRQAYMVLGSPAGRQAYDEKSAQSAPTHEVGPEDTESAIRISGNAKVGPDLSSDVQKIATAAARKVAIPIWLIVVVSVAVGLLAAAALHGMFSGSVRGAGVDKWNVGAVSGPELISALKSLKNLESATEVGLDYKEYSRRLVDTHAPVRNYLDSIESQQAPYVAKKIEESMSLFIAARDIWMIKIKADSTWVFSGNSYYGQLIRAYPAATAFVESGSIGGTQIRVDLALQDAWMKAGAALQEAERAASTPEK